MLFSVPCLSRFKLVKFKDHQKHHKPIAHDVLSARKAYGSSKPTSPTIYITCLGFHDKIE